MTNSQKPNNRWVDLLSSTRLAAYVLIALGMACLAGVLLPQKWVTLQPNDYVVLMGNPLWQILDRLGFLSVFRSVWFIALVGLLLVNLSFCTWRGLVRLQKRLKLDRRPITESRAKNQIFFRSWAPMGDHTEIVETTLSRLGSVTRESEGSTTWFRLEKGRLARYAPYLVHASIFILIAGALIDVFIGVSGVMNIPEGGTESVFQTMSHDGRVQRYRLPFEVRCDDFTIETYPGSERPKDFKSQLAVIENGTETLAKTIEVNDPLVWKGFRIFQSSYGRHDGKVELRITRRADNARASAAAQLGEPFEVEDFTKEFQTIGENAESIPGIRAIELTDARSDVMGNGPAVRVAMKRTDKIVEPFWLFLDSPDFDDVRKGPYRLQVEGFKQGYYTGLRVVRTPGVWLIWLGCTLFLLAIMYGFFVPHRRAWARVEAGRIIMAGTSNRSKEAWADRLAENAERLDAILGITAEQERTRS
jgi:cytochrome c biogenesis protein